MSAAKDEWGTLGIELRFVDLGDCRRVTLKGELDVAIRGAQESAFLKLIAESPTDVTIVDVSDVTFCDSTGAGVLIQAAFLARQAGSVLRVAAPTPWVRNVLMTSDVSHLVALFETWEQARAALPGAEGG